ncbi:hypothetical protein L3Q82_003478 [Scortum barcoo]|uniref:Uncharacterized protein n=1 Tax=Scortum barcoo TaxID=214431 RepID=A0ACB8VMB6_9TELE|nr:hypothetical protein L3Q82_003478 [Scortum barcoo]
MPSTVLKRNIISMENIKGSKGVYRPIRVMFNTPIYEWAVQTCSPRLASLAYGELPSGSSGPQPVRPSKTFATELRKVFGEPRLDPDVTGGKLNISQGNRTIQDYAIDSPGSPLTAPRPA